MATNTTTVVHQQGGVKTGMTALAGGAAPTLAANTLEGVNVISVVATDGDSVILPAGMPQGTLVFVANQDAAQDVHVFPNTGGTIQGGTATTGDISIGETAGGLFLQVGETGLTWICFKTAVSVPA